MIPVIPQPTASAASVSAVAATFVLRIAIEYALHSWVPESAASGIVPSAPAKTVTAANTHAVLGSAPIAVTARSATMPSRASGVSTSQAARTKPRTAAGSPRPRAEPAERVSAVGSPAAHTAVTIRVTNAMKL